MQVTDVNVILNTGSKVKATVDLVLDNELEITGIRIVEVSNNKLLIAFPNKRYKEKFLDIAHPINSRTREYIQKEILKKYNKMLKK